MRKNITRMLAAFVLLAMLPALALAADYAVVKGGRLNLRRYASSDSASLGKYDTGTWVRITGDAYNGWYPVRTLTGKEGYMSAGYLALPAYGNQGTVRYANGGYVNLRYGPSLNDAVVMRVTSGSTVYIVSSTGEWHYVYTYSGGSQIYGYMHNSFINTGVSTSVVTTRNGGKVNVRSGPGSSFGSVGKLATGTQVTVLLKGNGWYMISAGGMKGFMSTQYLSGSGSTVGNYTGTVTTSQTAYVNNPRSTQVLNLRETPSQSARSIGQYRNGTRVKVVSKGATWCEVYVGTRHGYMMTRYLSFDGNYLPPQDYDYSYPIKTAPPYAPIYPITTVPPYEIVYPTPTPLVQYITPKPTGPAAPKAGDTVTLAVSAGSGSGMINVYHDSSLTQLKATYTAGTQAMMLQYGTSNCMIYIGGGVAYVSTWNVNY